MTPNRKFKNFKFFPNFRNILNVYFWGDNVYFWGDNVDFWEIRFTLNWEFSKILGFWDFFFCRWGGRRVWDSVGRGPFKGFRQEVNFTERWPLGCTFSGIALHKMPRNVVFLNEALKKTLRFWAFRGIQPRHLGISGLFTEKCFKSGSR